MNLILTSAARLRAVYGTAAARRVLAAIERLVNARASRGVASLVVHIEVGNAERGVSGVAWESTAIARQVFTLAVARRDERPSSVLIIGGPDVVPFHEAQNPTPHDRDPVVPGDWIYGSRGPFGDLVWPVGRIPGAADDGATLVKLIDNAANAAPEPPGTAKPFGYCTAIWQESASAVYATIDAPERLLVSPPELAATFDHSRLDGARLIYANLHGLPAGPAWYGQSHAQPTLVVAVRPVDLEGLDLRRAVVVSEACYGAAITGRTAENSLALAFLAHGAIGFVGSTTLSYGPPGPPLGEADLIAQHFLRAATQPGTTLGAAFAAARAGMLKETLDNQGRLDEDDQKTLLQFVLYGDPTILIG